MNLIVNIFLTGLALILGNFAYQLFQTDPNWMIAFERSYFQFIMLIFVILQVWRTT